MAYTVAKKPHLSIVLPFHNGEDVLSRSVESVLSQDYRNFEFILVDCASSDHSAQMACRSAERDIRVELITLDITDMGSGIDAALARVKGEFLLLMEQGDWLSSGFLAQMMACIETQEPDLVLSAMSLDTQQRDGSRRATMLEPAPRRWSEAGQFRCDVAALIAEGSLVSLTGKLLRTEQLCSLGWRFAKRDPFESALLFYESVSEGSVLHEPLYHAMSPGSDALQNTSFDPSLYSNCERHHELLCELHVRWGLENNMLSIQALHRLHLSEIIYCIENISVNARALSSIERYKRVQDIIDAPSTRASIAALHNPGKEFGLMFTSISHRSAFACCAGARLLSLMSRAFPPKAFSPVLRPALF